MFNQNKSIEEKMAGYKEKKVTVHVWTSEHNIHKKGIRFGCVSLELAGKNKMYISFNKHDSSGNSQEENAEITYNTSLEEDIQSLSRKPEYTFNFYTLNQEAIINKAKTLDEEGLINKDSKSSASYIWQLLEAGQINNHIPTTELIVGRAEDVLEAKENALKAKAVVLEKKTSILAPVVAPVFFAANPAAGTIAAGVGMVAHVLSELAPEEIKKHPVENIIHPTVYCYENLYQRRPCADSIVKKLEIAQADELERDPFIKKLNERIQSDKVNCNAKSEMPKK